MKLGRFWQWSLSWCYDLTESQFRGIPVWSYISGVWRDSVDRLDISRIAKGDNRIQEFIVLES